MPKHITKVQIGRTLFIVSEEFSQNATETIEQKLKKLIMQHALDGRKVIGELSSGGDNQLAICGDQSEDGQYQTESRRSTNEEEAS